MKAVFVNHRDLMYLSNEAIRQLWDDDDDEGNERTNE